MKLVCACVYANFFACHGFLVCLSLYPPYLTSLIDTSTADNLITRTFESIDQLLGSKHSCSIFDMYIPAYVLCLYLSS